MIRFLAVSAVLALAACGLDAPPPQSAPVASVPGSAPQVATNARRSANGRGAVLRVTKLDQMARSHAQDLVRNNRFSHAGTDGSDLIDRADRVGYRYCFIAENIAKGQPDLESVMTSWMNSPGHRRNMLDPRATELGFAQAGDIWVMVLGSSNC